MDTARTILRSAKSFFVGTALSRMSGLFRDIAIALSFGSSVEIAAFMVSYRLANLFRRLLGEGNLNAAFVPHFTSLKEGGGYFYRDVIYSMGIILIGAVLVLEAALIGLDFLVDSNWKEIIHLTMWMVPGLFFICLYGLGSALLQCRGKYFIPAIAPVVFNLIWIVSCFWFKDVKLLALTITIAFAGQWGVTIFEGLKLLSLKQWLRPKIFSPEFRKLVRPMMLGIVGVGAVQFNSAFDAIFARIADLKGPAFLWYAIRIQQLPIALFGIALSGALLPPLSRETDPEKRNGFLISALKQGAALMLSCTFGIFALSEMGINLLFGHGGFTVNDVVQTSHCLWGYGIGLVPSIFVLILATNEYSKKNYRLPMIASVASVAVSIALNMLFVFGLGYGAISVAISTSLSSFVNAYLLLPRSVFPASFWAFIGKMGFANLLACLVVVALKWFWQIKLAQDLAMQSIQFALLALLYVGILGLLSWRAALKELGH